MPSTNTSNGKIANKENSGIVGAGLGDWLGVGDGIGEVEKVDRV